MKPNLEKIFFGDAFSGPYNMVCGGNDMYNYGDIVTVKAFPNKVLERRVVGVADNKTVYLCNESEFILATERDEKPTSIGFPIEDVIEVKHRSDERE